MSLLQSRTYADSFHIIILDELSINFTLLAHGSCQFKHNWIPEKSRQYPIKGEISEILSSLSSKFKGCYLRKCEKSLNKVPTISTERTGWSDKRKSLSVSFVYFPVMLSEWVSAECWKRPRALPRAMLFWLPLLHLTPFLSRFWSPHVCKQWSYRKWASASPTQVSTAPVHLSCQLRHPLGCNHTP